MFAVICRGAAVLKRNATRDSLMAFALTVVFLLAASPADSDDQASPTLDTKKDKALGVETSLVTFDELISSAKSYVQRRRFPTDVYRDKHGLLMGTCELAGTPEIGKAVRLTNPVGSFEIICAKNQPFISPHSIVLATGGGTRDLLLTFETPVTSISIVSDKSSETPDVIRLLIVEPLESDQRLTALERNAGRQVEVRVVAVDEKQDDANSAPGNTLSVDLKGKPFHHVVIECTTEQEGFDDLKFTRAKGPPEDDKNRAAPLFDWAWYAKNDGLEPSWFRAHAGNQSILTVQFQKVLERKNDLFSLEATGTNFTDAQLAELKEMKTLKTLGLGGTTITDQGLSALRGLTELQHLTLRGSRTSDFEAPDASSELKTMQALGLRPKISDAGLKELTELRHLKWLDLADTQITDVGLAELRKLTNLEELGLTGTMVTNVGIKELQGLEHLQVLDLWGTRVDDAGLIELSGIKSLRHVIVGPPVTRHGIERVHKIRSDCAFTLIGQEYRAFEALGLSGRNPGEGSSRLQIDRSGAEQEVVETKLKLANTNISDAKLKFMSNLRNVVAIDLTGTEITDIGLNELKDQKTLRELNVGGTRITDEGLASLRGLTELRHLDLSGARVQDHGPKWSGAELKVGEVRRLQSLGQRPQITGMGLKHLRGLKKLESLSLYGTQTTDAGIAEVRELRSLKTLRLAYTDITSAAIQSLEPLEYLESLDLRGTRVNGEGLLHLAKLKSLRNVTLDYRVNPDAIASAQKLMPNCKFNVRKEVNTGR